MNLLIDIGMLVVGLVLLTAGAEVLIRGASALAVRVGVSKLLVGLTVVAFGTSLPELGVSLLAALRGQADLSLGNVVGSNIYNVLLILGTSAILSPLAVSTILVRIDLPFMIATSILLVVQAGDGLVSRADGLVLLIGMGLYMLRIMREGSQGVDGQEKEGETTSSSLARELLTVVGGLLLLVGGTELLVDAAVAIARALGVTELVIGLTIVAAGTSLPETATSVLAAWRGERDIAIGNIVGSNIFNILSVLGVATTVSAVGVTVAPAAWSLDLPVMLAVACVCLPICITGAIIDRIEGTVLLGWYLAYLWFLIHAARGGAEIPGARAALIFLVPALSLMAFAVDRWWKPEGDPIPAE